MRWIWCPSDGRRVARGRGSAGLVCLEPAELLADLQPLERNFDPRGASPQILDEELAIAFAGPDDDEVGRGKAPVHLAANAGRPGSPLRDRHPVQRALVRRRRAVRVEKAM